MFFKDFDIRWGDIDANSHLGNASYVEYMSHTRMSFFAEMGLDLSLMRESGLGPIALYEHIYYFREVKLADKIKVSLEIVGMTEDAQFIKIEHNFYNEEGLNLAFSEILFSWIDLESRKLGRLSESIKVKILSFPKANRFRTIERPEIRKAGIRPRDLK